MTWRFTPQPCLPFFGFVIQLTLGFVFSGRWLHAEVTQRYELLKGKRKNIKHFKSSFEQKSVGIRQHQKGGDSEPSTNTSEEGKDFHREKTEEKQGIYLIGYDLSICLIWKRLVECF